MMTLRTSSKGHRYSPVSWSLAATDSTRGGEPSAVGAESFSASTVLIEVGAVPFGPGVILLEPGVASFGLGTALFVLGADTFGGGAVMFGPTLSSFDPGAVSFGPGEIWLRSGAVVFGSGAVPFEPGAVVFGLEGAAIGARALDVDVDGPKFGVSGADSVYSEYAVEVSILVHTGIQGMPVTPPFTYPSVPLAVGIEIREALSSDNTGPGKGPFGEDAGSRAAPRESHERA